MKLMQLKDLLIKHEGCEKFPYRDTKGITTIGIGRNLEAKGLRDDEIALMFENDLNEAITEAQKYIWFSRLSEPRQHVIVSMIFNLGPKGFAKFKATIRALEKEDYAEAAKEMLNSVWAVQVKDRATELSWIMRHGIYPPSPR